MSPFIDQPLSDRQQHWSVGREFAVLMVLVSGLGMMLEPSFNPLLGCGVALGYLLHSVLHPRSQPPLGHRYRRTLAGFVGGALGGLLLGAAIAMGVATATEALVDASGLTWNTFVVGMLLGGSLIGMKYMWRNAAPRTMAGSGRRSG